MTPSHAATRRVAAVGRITAGRWHVRHLTPTRGDRHQVHAFVTDRANQYHRATPEHLRAWYAADITGPVPRCPVEDLAWVLAAHDYFIEHEVDPARRAAGSEFASWRNRLAFRRRANP